eukprot:513918_1
MMNAIQSTINVPAVISVQLTMMAPGHANGMKSCHRSSLRFNALNTGVNIELGSTPFLSMHTRISIYCSNQDEKHDAIEHSSMKSNQIISSPFMCNRNETLFV